jgi:tetratricopeptide (TPR) repeat protein
LLRSRAATLVDAHATLTSSWTDLVAQEPVNVDAAHRSAAAELIDNAPPKPGLGPETSVLKREPLPEIVAIEQLPPTSATVADQQKDSSLPALPLLKTTADSEVPAPAATVGDADTSVVDAADAAATLPAEGVTEAETQNQPTPEVETKTARQPIAAVPEEAPTLSIDPASFRGIYPGKTSQKTLDLQWGKGEAFSREDGSTGFFWNIDPFERVEVTIDGETVDSIRIKLANPVAVSELAAQLEIADLRTVSILDEQGISIGEVFPERGVIFSVKPGTQSATAVMLEPLDPESFVLRAEGEIDTNTAYAMADLQYAIEIDSEHLRAHRLLLVLMCEEGRWLQALQLAEAAEQLDAVDIWTRLKLAGVLLSLDRIDESREKVLAVQKQENLPPLVVAQSERLLGRIALAAQTPEYPEAVEHFSQAIRKATPLMTARSKSVQQAAREVLLDAHLGTALAIARGTWQQKSRVIPKWIARSEALAADLKPESLNKDDFELQLCRGVLEVAASSSEAIEPLPWVKRLLVLRESFDAKIADPMRRRQIDWEVGQGLSDALLAGQKRGDTADMLDNATLTAAYLERGCEQRELSALEKRAIGDLSFRIGILHSLQKGDHATAVAWFDKTIPLWEENPSFARDGQTGRLGESLVSMAISYWQMERREDAVGISRKGVDLMVEAIDRKQLDERSLAVAYGNLSTMYAEQGDDEQSQTYAEMASRAEATGAFSSPLQR